jgi:hypothetical protein
MDSGLDSLGGMELKNTIESRVGVELPVTAAFEYPTIAALAGYLSAMLDASEAGSEAGSLVESSLLQPSSTLSSSTLSSSYISSDSSGFWSSSHAHSFGRSPFLTPMRAPSEVECVPLFFLAPLYAKAQMAYHGIAEALDSGDHPIYALEKDPELNLEANLQQVRSVLSYLRCGPSASTSLDPWSTVRPEAWLSTGFSCNGLRSQACCSFSARRV